MGRTDEEGGAMAVAAGVADMMARQHNKERRMGGGEVGSGVELNGRSTANTELDHRQYGKTVVRMIRNYAGDAEKTEEVGKR